MSFNNFGSDDECVGCLSVICVDRSRGSVKWSACNPDARLGARTLGSVGGKGSPQELSLCLIVD